MGSRGKLPKNLITITKTLFDVSPLYAIELPSTVRTIEEEGFRCTRLKTIDISNVTSVGKRAFNMCEYLEAITLGDITSIPADLFNGCKSLKEIKIPASVTSLAVAHDGAPFEGTNSLETVIIDSSYVAGLLTGFGWKQIDIESHCGLLIDNAKTIYLKTGLEATDFVKANYEEKTTDKDGYTMWVKK